MLHIKRSRGGYIVCDRDIELLKYRSPVTAVDNLNLAYAHPNVLRTLHELRKLGLLDLEHEVTITEKKNDIE